MTVELINQTHYAIIYGVKDENGRTVGTVEERLAGRDVGTYSYVWAAGYGKRDIRRYYTEYRKEQEKKYTAAN
jgi:hypothetical protein